jgi:hypothetical protein
MATRGFEPELNEQRAFEILENLSDELEKHNTHHPETEFNLARMYLVKADRVQVSQSIYCLQQAIRHFVKGTIRNYHRTSYLEAKRLLAMSYDRLIQLGVDVRENLSKCLLIWEELAAAYLKDKLLADYADVQLHIAQAHSNTALNGVDVKDNMGSAISHLKISIAHYEELHQWNKYYLAKTNLVWSYRELFLRDIDPPNNWMEMKRTVDDGITIFSRHGLTDKENEFKKMLQRINADNKVIETDNSLKRRKGP